MSASKRESRSNGKRRRTPRNLLAVFSVCSTSSTQSASMEPPHARPFMPPQPQPPMQNRYPQQVPPSWGAQPPPQTQQQQYNGHHSYYGQQQLQQSMQQLSLDQHSTSNARPYQPPQQPQPPPLQNHYAQPPAPQSPTHAPPPQTWGAPPQPAPTQHPPPPQPMYNGQQQQPPPYYGQHPQAQPMPHQPMPHQPMQQQQRLDPDAMPSVVQVIEDDRSKFNSSSNVLFQTTIPAQVPPLITTFGVDGNGIAEDGGTARPGHIRCTVYQAPQTEDLLKTTGIPLSITVKPFDEGEVDGHFVSVTCSRIS